MGERAEHHARVAELTKLSQPRRPGCSSRRPSCSCAGARVAHGAHGPIALAVVLAVPLLVLNAVWYAFVYHIQPNLAPIQRTIAALESLAPDGSRITAVVPPIAIRWRCSRTTESSGWTIG